MITTVNKKEDILSYNPDLGIYTKPNVVAEYEGYAEPITINPNKSSLIEEFEYNMPSDSLSLFTDALDRSQLAMEKTIEKIKNNSIGLDYLATKGKDEKELISEKNKYDIENGTSSIEVLEELQKISSEVIEVMDKVLICMYGKDVDIDGAKEIDIALINRLNLYESNGEFEKINYFSIYYDIQISYLLREYMRLINELIGDLLIISDEENALTLNQSNMKLFKDKFFKLNEILDNDIYKDSKSCKDILRTLNNMFITKSNANMYMDTFSNLFKCEAGHDVITEMNVECIEELEEVLDDLVKALMYSPLAKDDTRNIIAKKSNLRSFFVSKN